MMRVETPSQLTSADIAAIEAMVDEVRSATGIQPLDEARWSDAVAGRSSFHAVVARAAGGTIGGYAQVTPADGGTAVDVVVPAGARATDDGPGLVDLLVRRAVALVAEHGGGEVQYWVHDPTPHDDALARSAGLTAGRELLQMQVTLPLAETTELGTRPFVPGRDEDAWLAVNNAAFDWHPEQGAWTHDDVIARQGESWFDADGFLLHEVDGRLAGFCWTKLHRPPDDAEPVVGEIYVIAVHPDFGGRGLGRALVVAGLAHLARDASVGMLYTEAENTPALRLYERLGFVTHHVSRAYVGPVTPAGGLP